MALLKVHHLTGLGHNWPESAPEGTGNVGNSSESLSRGDAGQPAFLFIVAGREGD